MAKEIRPLHDQLPAVSMDQLSDSGKPMVLVTGGGGIAPGVITATVTIVQQLLEKGFHPVGLVGSWEGVQKRGAMGFVDFPQINEQTLEGLISEGGTCLGPGRGMLRRDEFHFMRELQDRIGFLGTAVVGGDGTIGGAKALQYSLDSSGRPVCNTVACIKTIDGDAELSIAIGFMTSAFKYAEAIQAMMRETPWEDGIGIVGVYGRDNGHLALRAAALAVDEKAPVITLLPEFHITRAHFLERLRALKAQHKNVGIVVSEGFYFDGEKPVMDEKRLDGAGNPKLLGCVELIESIIREDEGIGALGDYKIRTSEPGILTRSCDPIDADVTLAQKAGTAVVDVIERKGWGHAVAMQGTFGSGFRPVTIPLWQVDTGNPVTADLYDTDTLQPTPFFRFHVTEQNPVFHHGNYDSLPEQIAAHERLLGLIRQSESSVHNGIHVPKWSIQFALEAAKKREQPTKWTEQIRALLAPN